MSAAETKRGLGRGLSALLGDTPAKPAAGTSRSQRHLPIGQLEPSPLQPRRHFDADELESLAESIRSNGILQPLLVRAHPTRPGMYEIVAGERRWRAAQIAKLHEVPVLERQISDREVLELAIVENVQRHDLSALEEAQGYRRLIDEFSRSQEELAQQVGKSRAHIANTLRLLKLPSAVQDLLQEGLLSAGHARALLAAADPMALAERVITLGLSVRQTEALAARPPSLPAARRPPRMPIPKRWSRTWAGSWGSRSPSNMGREAGASGGSLTIRYQSLEQLDDVIRRLNRNSSTARSRRASAAGSGSRWMSFSIKARRRGSVALGGKARAKRRRSSWAPGVSGARRQSRRADSLPVRARENFPSSRSSRKTVTCLAGQEGILIFDDDQMRARGLRGQARPALRPDAPVKPGRNAVVEMRPLELADALASAPRRPGAGTAGASPAGRS